MDKVLSANRNRKTINGAASSPDADAPITETAPATKTRASSIATSGDNAKATARIPWQCLSADEALARLDVSRERGLSATAVSERLERFGHNEIREQKRRSPWRMLAEQFTEFMIIVLMVAAAISALIGEPEDSFVIMAIVLLNGVIGFIQEYRAERAIAALKRLAAASARALREGKVVEIPAAQLVPGDIVLLEAGNVVPADLRLIESAALKVEEAALTGESVPVEKDLRPLPDQDQQVGDRKNMAFKGTTIAYGRGRGVVIATGMQTELGTIASLLADKSEVRTPLQKRLTAFGKRIALVCLVVCAVVFALGVMRGEPLALMFLTAVSLAVAAIPEALPAVVTTSLALGAYKMVKRNALIRRLPAVETLGSVSYICSDKTGTLTQNKMRVEQVWADGQLLSAKQPLAKQSEGQQLLYAALALNNDAVIGEGGNDTGDPTEIALLREARAAGLEKSALEAASPRVAELPFDSERKCMTTVHRAEHDFVAFTKGAPEKLVERCKASFVAGVRTPIDKDAVLRCAERMAESGLRVMAIAYRPWVEIPEPLTPEAAECGLIFLGLVGMMDPPRPEAQEAVAMCKSAGITPVMVTGDHPVTARAIAQRLGIIGEGGRVITGKELADLSPEEFRRQVKDISVYARVDPSQKINIVEALQARGEYVAMTGDGVNDAPAIKRAEIGVAMGKIGTDVAREASHMVLLDDNFATIVGAVREGRRIYDNIRKFIRFVMGGNSGEIWTIAAAPMLGLPLPLLPIQILWVNLITDGLPGLALAAEREERNVMRRAPRPATESVFAHGLWQHTLWVGLLIGAICIALQSWAMNRGSENWQTVVFTALAMCQMYHVLAIRSERDSTFTIGFFSNLPLCGAVALTLLLQFAVIYIPALNPIFKTQPLTGVELAASTLLPALVFVGVEIEKWMIRRGLLYASNPVIAKQRQESLSGSPAKNRPDRGYAIHAEDT
ncbi:MAG: cation-translocating P-type ATPase [Betaproteobacteria bacterium]|nr:cation-translocating P-type ATPase [Betaproteobacteria bacterium]